MDQTSTTADAPADGQTPESAQGQTPETQTPETTTNDEPKGGKTFDEQYVRGLRKESATMRTKLAETEAQLAKLTDRDKTEHEKLTERATASEQRAGAAESKLMRYEIVAERGLKVSDVTFLTGETREEMEANADALAARLADQSAADQPKPPSFDGGARQTPDATKTPEAAHNDFLLAAMGRPTS